jgi:hypothetical protein
VPDDDHRWAHETRSLRGLNYRFGVRSEDEVLGRRVDALLAGLRDAGPIEHWYALTASASVPDAVDLTRDGHIVALGQRPGDAVGWLVWDVNRATADASGEHLLFHAGALQLTPAQGPDRRGIVLPGASGSGKSTLSAGLVRAGLGYLTDELVALDLTSGQLLPYPKPITVKPGSFAVLQDLVTADGRCGHDGQHDQEWHLVVGDGALGHVGEPCVPGFVVLPRYEPGAPTRLERLSETGAFLELALHAVNFLDHGDAGIEALGALAATCECALVTMSDLDEACRLVLDFVGLREAECAR